MSEKSKFTAESALKICASTPGVEVKGRLIHVTKDANAGLGVWSAIDYLKKVLKFNLRNDNPPASL